MFDIPKIILLIDTSRLFGRGLISGIVKYCRFHTPWSFYSEPGTNQNLAIPLLKNWKADGIILQSSYFEATKSISVETPRIVITDNQRIPGYPNVIGDSKATGFIAAEYLLGKNLQHFSYSGWSDLIWSKKRGKAFCEYVENAGYKTFTFQQPFPRFTKSWDSELTELVNWLIPLPKPIGLFACNDDNARHILEACKIAKIRVPDDIAVLGVDNDETVCELTTPPLSSISVNLEKAGYEAAQRLDKMMNHSKEMNSNSDIIIDPLCVTTRQSTDTFACQNKDVVNAIRFIYNNSVRPIQVAEVADHVALPVRTLQRYFITELGYSIFKAIQFSRIAKVSELLITTSLNISEIANFLGYSDSNHISRSFKRVKKMTPLEYRKKKWGDSRYPLK